MKKAFLLVILTLAGATFANAQKPVYDRNNVMTAFYNIGDNDGSDCRVERITGKVVSVDEDYPDASAIILTSRGKSSVNVNTESMSMADRSNFFYSLFKRGKRVQIVANVCGTGSFMYATSVKLAGAVSTKRKAK
jgi:hypothetical protein